MLDKKIPILICANVRFGSLADILRCANVFESWRAMIVKAYERPELDNLHQRVEELIASIEASAITITAVP